MFPVKQIDNTRKKLNIPSKQITPHLKTFLSDFVYQIGNYVSSHAHNLDDLLQEMNHNHPSYVDSMVDIMEKVVKNQKRKKGKFELSFSVNDLQNHLSFHKKVKKEDLIRIAATIEMIIGDLMVELNKKSIEDIFTEPSNPLYDLFMITFGHEKNKKIKKDRKKSSIKSRRSKISRKSQRSQTSRKSQHSRQRSRSSRRSKIKK